MQPKSARPQSRCPAQRRFHVNVRHLTGRRLRPALRKSNLAAGARTIAQWSSSDGRTPYVAYEKGVTIADGSTAEGRRIYFALYDDTFRYLTADGLKLFDAAVLWAAGASPRITQETARQ